MKVTGSVVNNATIAQLMKRLAFASIIVHDLRITETKEAKKQ